MLRQFCCAMPVALKMKMNSIFILTFPEDRLIIGGAKKREQVRSAGSIFEKAEQDLHGWNTRQRRRRKQL